MLTAAFEALRRVPGGSEDQTLTIELVFDEGLTPAEVAARLESALPGSGARAEPVFDSAADRFWFVRFPGLSARGQEAEVFAFARDLAPAVGATDANPVLADSLYGAVAVADVTTESFLRLCETPRMNLQPTGWHHAVIRTPQAWALTRGEGATVAVIDTGYSGHQELSGAIRGTGQRNFVEGGTDAQDRFSSGVLRMPGHGTLVCSVIASRGTADAQGNVGGPGAVTGTAPAAQVLPIRAIKSVIDFDQSTIAPAIAHAVAQGADVIAMALGGPTRVASTEKALRDAVRAGVVIVCAAGNCWPSVVFPAAYAAQGLCTAVAALTRDLTPWRQTGRGPEVTIAAPGENVWGAAKGKASDPDNGIRASQGTTLATSMTAGVAALWVARHGGRAALKARADAAGTSVQAMWVRCATGGLVRPDVWAGATDLGAGVLDAERALAAALPAGAESAAPPSDRVETTAAILRSHLANHRPEAVAEVDSAIAPYAAELIWLSYRAGARGRAVRNSPAEAMAPADTPSPGLAAAVAGRPGLAALLAGGP